MASGIRDELIDQMTGQHAHVSFDNAVDGMPVQETGIRPESLPYSIWELVEHIRIAQYDIVEFCIDTEYSAPRWPDDYWPPRQKPSDAEEWNRSLEAVRTDRQRMIELVRDTGRDLFEPFPHGDGQTLFREAVLIIDHTSYHTGQIVTVRKLLGLWR